MATPTRSHVVSTPKNPLNTTPSRPGTSFANKHLAGKSPAVKTPASIHGHAHRISASSHPTSTPLAASMLPDDILNLSTPSAAALMATMGTTGLTPMHTTQDGLGISTSIHGGSTQEGSTVRNPQLDRHARLREIAQTLKQKSAGRGVTKKSIKQVAQINGFEADWDDDTNTLTLAGKKYVEVEIVFDQSDINVVDKTVFKLNFPEEDEAVLQEEDSRVLQYNLTGDEHANLPWHDLTDFSANLNYLGQLEHVETPGNCFKIIDNLYETFQKIWIEEKKRMKWRHDVHHLCQSNIGEPRRNVHERLGVSSRYWIDGLSFFTKPGSKLDEPRKQGKDWNAKFWIESGQPSIPGTQNWVADEPLVSTITAEDIFQDSAIDKPVWLDPNSSQSKALGEEDPMKLDEPTIDIDKNLNIHFVCQLEPEVLLPLQVAQSFNQSSRMFNMQQNDLCTFYHLLHIKADQNVQNIKRWTRIQQSFDRDGKMKESKHSYMLYAGGWVYPVRQFSFWHPRQYAELLPVLRQYALVNKLLQSVAVTPDSEKSEQQTFSTSDNDHKELVDRTKVIKRSNKPKLETKLNEILRPNASIALSNNTNILPIDIRLDPNSSENKSCRIELRIPLSPNVLPRTALTNLNAKAFLILTIDVLRNGIAEILNIEGIDFKEKLDEMKKRLAKVVRASEDLGVVTDWFLRELGCL